MKKIILRIKQLLIILKYTIVKIFLKNDSEYINTWLISERGDEARDNGYAFYKYIKDKHPEISIKYIISKNSIDIDKIDKSDIIFYRSLEHYKAFINSKYLISTHIMGFSPEYKSFSKLSKKIKFFNGNGKKIFLQHGITKDYIEFLTSKKIDLDLFICGAKPEYEFIKNNFGFGEKIVKYTGFSRFDYLDNSKIEKIILFMPTWRNSFSSIKSLNDFMKTDYYININNILNDNDLNNYFIKKNIKMIFYPHVEIQKFVNTFKSNNKNIIIANSKEYNISNLLKECSMLLTDYSSVFFDVAYMRKPIVYYQYDYDAYRKNHYKEGYFKYEKAFGRVCNNLESLKQEIIKIIENDFECEEVYLKRINEFFTVNDKDNSERIYNEINKL